MNGIDTKKLVELQRELKRLEDFHFTNGLSDTFYHVSGRADKMRARIDTVQRQINGMVKV